MARMPGLGPGGRRFKSCLPDQYIYYYDLKVKSVIITGGSEGLGLALAKKFKTKGWNVISIARHECPEDNVVSVIADLSTFLH